MGRIDHIIGRPSCSWDAKFVGTSMITKRARKTAKDDGAYVLETANSIAVVAAALQEVPYRLDTWIAWIH